MMKINLIPAIEFFLACFLGYIGKFCDADYLAISEPLSIPVLSGILISTTSWRQTLAGIYKKHVGAYADTDPIGYNSRGERKWERYDDEALEYPHYDASRINWLLRSKYQKMKKNISSKHEFPIKSRKQFVTPNPVSDVAQLSTSTDHTTETLGKNEAVTAMKTTSKHNLISKVVTPKAIFPKEFSVASTTMNSRRKSFTHIQSLHGLIVKKTIYEDILEEQNQASIASYATMATLLLLLFLAIFLYIGSKNKVKHKVCGRKLQNRRHTLMEVVASTKLMGPTNHRESCFLKGARDACSTKNVERGSWKKKLSEISEEKHLVSAADESEEEFSLLVPVNKVKELRHPEA